MIFFSVEDAYGWVSRVERYFELKGVINQEKIQAVKIAMEGKVLPWLQWWELCAQNPSWEDFRSTVIQRFQHSTIQSPYELRIKKGQN